MAVSTNRKIWETAFLLTASTDGNFKETFDTAQKAIAGIRDELGETESFAQQTGSAFEAAATAIAASGIYEALGKVVDIYQECVTTSMNFESMMSSVGAISGASVSDMDLLTEKAEELGANTVFSAYESAQAMTYMAQAGWETGDMLEGMDGVIALAAASGEDLAMVSSVVADTLAGFQMDASETARMADVLAQTAAKTNTGVLEMGESFKNSAALAGALGYSIEDVSVMMGLMANAGVKGSVAGTTMKNILNGFVEGATLKSTAFGEVEFTAVNPDGSVKSLSETVEELRGYFSQMSASEKLTNAESIAGMRGYVGLTAVLEATDEQYQKLYEDINNCTGAAQEMADVRLDNLKGDIELFQSAVEGLEIAVGEDFNPGLRETVQLGTDIVDRMTEFVNVHPGVVEGISSVTATLGSGLAVMSGAAAIVTLFKALGGFATFGHPVVIAVGAIAAAIGGLTAAVIMSKDETNLLISETNELIDMQRSLSDEYGSTIDQLDAQYGSYFELANEIERLAEKEDKTLTEKQLLLELVDDLNEAVPGLNLAYDAQADSLNMATESLHAYIEEMYEAQVQQERMARIMELKQQGEEYAEQRKTLEAELKSLEEREAALLDEMGGSVRGKKAQEYLSVQQDREEAESALYRLKAAMATNSWEYQSVFAESEAYLKAQSTETQPVESEVIEAADVITTNNSTNTEKLNINITMGGDVPIDKTETYNELLEKLGNEIAIRFGYRRAGVMYN